MYYIIIYKRNWPLGMCASSVEVSFVASLETPIKVKWTVSLDGNECKHHTSDVLTT